MIEISLGKLVLLALIALIVLGPEKLPVAARTAGALLRRLRGGWDSVRAEVERELQLEEIKRTAREAAAHAETAQSELDATLRQVREPFAQAAGELGSVGVTAPISVAAPSTGVDASPPISVSGGVAPTVPAGEPHGH